MLRRDPKGFLQGFLLLPLASRIGAREYASVAKYYTAHLGRNDAAEKQLKRVAKLLHVKT
jgi:hypothetical protein